MSKSEYFPYGMKINDLSYNAQNIAQPRYGYNGKEQDNEIKGENNSLDFGARIYDPRVSRFLSQDPLNGNFPWLSSYLYANNNPIRFIDENGESGKDVVITASKYIGTPYEYGGRNPYKIGGYPEGFNLGNYLQVVKPGIIDKWSNNQNYKSQALIAKFPILNAINKAGKSIGIDCSGHAIKSFNSDPDKLMPDLGDVNVVNIRKAFADAEINGTGELRDDFENIKEGDLVFKPSLSHIWVATGNTKTFYDKKLNVEKNQIEVIDTRSTGKEVIKHFIDVIKGMEYGHTKRTEDIKVNTQVEGRVNDCED